MNFKNVEENAKNYKTIFDLEFLSTILMCQGYALMLKEEKSRYGNQEIIYRLKTRILDTVETLRCFVRCSK